MRWQIWIIVPMSGCWLTDADVNEFMGISGDTSGRDALAGFIRIPNGTFTMGSPLSEVGRMSEETQHTVTLTHAFFIGTTEVTQEAFERLMGYNPSSFSGDGKLPVEGVSWHEAAAYANAISSDEGLARCYSCSGSDSAVECSPSGNPYSCEGYRLPTEAEWEYAARAGSTAAFSDGGNLESGDGNGCPGNAVLTSGTPLEDLAWFCAGSNEKTHPVGDLAPNEWGLYDVHGNAREWVGDWWNGEDDYDGNATDPTGDGTGTERLVRGGSWFDEPWSIRAARRKSENPSPGEFYTGFRLARSIP